MTPTLTPRRAPGQTRRGIIAMIAGGALFVVNDALVKSATMAMPTGQLLVVRGGFAILCILTVIIAMGDARRLPSAIKPVVILRASLEFLVTLSYITAISALPIGELTSVMQATPIIMTILCAVFRIETVGWLRWAAVLVGFSGVLMITEPGGADFSVYSLIALASASFVALRDLVTRKIHGDLPPTVVILTTTVFAACGGFVIGQHEVWNPLSMAEYAGLAGAAVTVSIANALMVIAYRNADISILSPLRYLVVVWAAGMGFAVFGEIPGLMALAGTILIVASGLATGFQERRSLRRARSSL
jgi:drug/metabolite transporter (DMT)-like permease